MNPLLSKPAELIREMWQSRALAESASVIAVIVIRRNVRRNR